MMLKNIFYVEQNIIIMIRCLALMVFIFVSSCSVGTRVPVDQENACSILAEKKSWKRYLLRTQKKWKVEPALVLSFIKTESNFRPRARTQRKYFLGLVPTGRISSAYGYAQVLDGTWERYEKMTNRRFARRTKFSDSVDFIGWYVNQTYLINGISKSDVYHQYLAYHQGHRGFKSGKYRNSTALKAVAKRTADTAGRYGRQLKNCL